MSRFRIVAAALTAAAVLATGSFAAGVRLAERESPGGFEAVVRAAEDIRREAAEPVSQRQLVRAAIRGMLQILDDPYAALLGADRARELDDLADGSFVGIGVWLEGARRGLRVTRVVPGSPAEGAGMRSGDVIVEVDDRSVRELSVEEAGRFIRGPEGTEVRIVVERGGGDVELVMDRARLPLEHVDARMVEDDVAYARLHQFGNGASETLRGELERLLERGARGVVLDLRGNPGGLADEAVKVAGLFLEDGVVARVREAGGEERILRAPGDPLAPVPLALVVDGGTASAAELVAAALQERGRATVVGTQTFGKGSVLTVRDVGDQASITFTTAHFLTPEGRRIEGRGVEPDIAVLPGGASDAQLDRALRVVRNAR